MSTKNAERIFTDIYPFEDFKKPPPLTGVLGIFAWIIPAVIGLVPIVSAHRPVNPTHLSTPGMAFDILAIAVGALGIAYSFLGKPYFFKHGHQFNRRSVLPKVEQLRACLIAEGVDPGDMFVETYTDQITYPYSFFERVSSSNPYATSFKSDGGIVRIWAERQRGIPFIITLGPLSR